MAQTSPSRYQLGEPIGSGGMSVVYRGRDTLLEREVAIKVLHPHLAGRPEARRRFSREARAVAKLHHPNILEIFDYSGEEAPEASMVTEFIRGETLKVFAERERCAPPEIAAMIVGVLASALDHAHKAGIIHRDLKPENVMIREDGILKLMDFGIAKVLDRDDAMTMTGALVGSPAHMAPEVIEDQATGPAADIWSLGTIFYYLCCGSLPFQGGNTTQTLRRVLDADFDDPRIATPALSEPLARILERCLAREPAARFPNVGALEEALREALSTVHLDHGTEALQAFFADPDGYRTRLTADLVALRLDCAEKAMLVPLRKRRPATALAALELVLALDPATPRGLALMKRLERRRRSGVLLLGAGLAALLGLGGMGGLALWRHASTHPGLPPANPPVTVTEPARPSESTPIPLFLASPETSPFPLRLASSTLPPVPPPRPERAPEKTNEKPADKSADKPEKNPTPVPPESPGAQGELAVAYTPRHFARILLDGKLLNANGAPLFQGKVAAGPHRIRVESDYCFPVQQTISVAEGKPLRLDLRLQRRPATLIVGSSQKNLLVFVDGTPRGTAGESEHEPIALPIPDGAIRTSLSLRFAREGYRTETRRIEVVSGRPTHLNVELEPL